MYSLLFNCTHTQCAGSETNSNSKTTAEHAFSFVYLYQDSINTGQCVAMVPEFSSWHLVFSTEFYLKV